MTNTIFTTFAMRRDYIRRKDSLVMAYPYDREVWEIVDGVVVTTHVEKAYKRL